MSERLNSALAQSFGEVCEFLWHPSHGLEVQVLHALVRPHDLRRHLDQSLPSRFVGLLHPADGEVQRVAADPGQTLDLFSFESDVLGEVA